jgi:hypothetical protein
MKLSVPLRRDKFKEHPCRIYFKLCFFVWPRETSAVNEVLKLWHLSMMRTWHVAP